MSPNRPLTILITGCSDGGIGSSLALAFHAHNPNHKIIATLRNPSKASALKPFSPAITIVPLDVLSAQSITSCVEQVSSLTNGKLDILLNNAGYGLTCPITDTNTDEARDLFNTNFFAVMDVTNAFLPLLLNSARDGRGPKPMIVNNTSIVGVIPMPWQGVYNASKAALASLTDTLRLELEVVGVNVVDLKTGAVKSGFFGNVAGGDQSGQSFFPCPP
jgi:short-subunit dehydrogenase